MEGIVNVYHHLRVESYVLFDQSAFHFRRRLALSNLKRTLEGLRLISNKPLRDVLYRRDRYNREPLRTHSLPRLL